MNETPVKSDVIIVLGGGSGERELQASRLYKEHYAPYIIVSNGGTRGKPSTEMAEKEIEWLRGYGVPDTAIIPELQSQSTYGNAVFSEVTMEKYNFRSAIVVSSSYHMRRGQYIFNKVFKGSGIRLTYCEAKVPDYSPNLWWTTLRGWGFTMSEYEKLAGYLILYGVFNNKDYSISFFSGSAHTDTLPPFTGKSAKPSS